MSKTHQNFCETQAQNSETQFQNAETQKITLFSVSSVLKMCEKKPENALLPLKMNHPILKINLNGMYFKKYRLFSKLIHILIVLWTVILMFAYLFICF